MKKIGFFTALFLVFSSLIISCTSDNDSNIEVCETPSNVTGERSSTLNTTVILNWEDDGTTSNWEVQFGLSGFEIGTGTTVTTNSSTISIPDIISSNNYDFYVRKVCSQSSSSEWSSVFTIEAVQEQIVHTFMSAKVNGVQHYNMKPYLYVFSGVKARIDSFNTEHRVLLIQGHSDALNPNLNNNNFVEITLRIHEDLWQVGTYPLIPRLGSNESQPNANVRLIVEHPNDPPITFESELPGTITILEFNSTTKRIRGTFSFDYFQTDFPGVILQVLDGTFDFPVENNVFE